MLFGTIYVGYFVEKKKKCDSDPVWFHSVKFVVYSVQVLVYIIVSKFVINQINRTIGIKI